jgi:hypothetical protein
MIWCPIINWDSALINTSLQRGGLARRADFNRFNGFPRLPNHELI